MIVIWRTRIGRSQGWGRKASTPPHLLSLWSGLGLMYNKYNISSTAPSSPARKLEAARPVSVRKNLPPFPLSHSLSRISSRNVTSTSNRPALVLSISFSSFRPPTASQAPQAKKSTSAVSGIASQELQGRERGMVKFPIGA